MEMTSCVDGELVHDVPHWPLWVQAQVLFSKRSYKSCLYSTSLKWLTCSVATELSDQCIQQQNTLMKLIQWRRAAMPQCIERPALLNVFFWWLEWWEKTWLGFVLYRWKGRSEARDSWTIEDFFSLRMPICKMVGSCKLWALVDSRWE